MKIQIKLMTGSKLVLEAKHCKKDFDEPKITECVYQDALKEISSLQKENELLEIRCKELFKKGQDDALAFYNKASHSIRIPSSIITGYADIILDGLVDDNNACMDYLKKICKQVYYLNDVFTQLLLEAKQESALPSIVTKQIDIVAILNQMTQDVSMIAEQKGINIQISSPCEELMLFADQTQLTKVFYNILENAMKYMNQSGKITITLSDLDTEVLIIFKDNGQGMPKEETSKIFDLNFQGSNKKYGNGLGLSMAKLVIAAHGGTIDAKSDVGIGMGIYITLPKQQKEC